MARLFSSNYKLQRHEAKGTQSQVASARIACVSRTRAPARLSTSKKTLTARAYEEEFIAAMRSHVSYVRSLLETVRPITRATRVLEVGSGAHGLSFYFGLRCIGVDPLAAYYLSLFSWQNRVPLVAANGNNFSFSDNGFEVVLCDNVVDHAEDPSKIVWEITPVLSPVVFSASL